MKICKPNFGTSIFIDILGHVLHDYPLFLSIIFVQFGKRHPMQEHLDEEQKQALSSYLFSYAIISR